jgi:hypothetical protein
VVAGLGVLASCVAVACWLQRACRTAASQLLPLDARAWLCTWHAPSLAFQAKVEVPIRGSKGCTGVSSWWWVGDITRSAMRRRECSARVQTQRAVNKRVVYETACRWQFQSA